MNNTEHLMMLCKNTNFDKEMAESLIQNENLNKVIEDKNTTFLYEAVKNGNIDMVKLLLEKGANPNFFAYSDGPALWDLQYNGFFNLNDIEQLELVKILLEYGADPNIEWEYEFLFDYIVYRVFNETDYEEWDYMTRFFVYLVAYGGTSDYYRPIIYENFDKSCLCDYKFCFLDNGSRGEIVKNGRRMAYI